MARGKVWHDANKLRRVRNAEAGKKLRTRDGCGRERGRAAWNRRRGLARAQASLQKELIALYGLRPRRRLRGKQPRHSLGKACVPDVGGALEAARISISCSSREDVPVVAWPTDVAVAGTPCAPDIASPTPLSEGEPLDDGMLALLEKNMKQEAGRDHKRLCQQTFRSLAMLSGARVR